MSLKTELEVWVAALEAYDERNYEESLHQFSRIADQAKILTNMGLVYSALGEHDAAIQSFFAATSLDPFLAIAYFQSGVSNFLLDRYELAYLNFKDALLYLRGNQCINYEQLGLYFRLFSAEILFNMGLCLIYLGRTGGGLAELEEARQCKITDEHDVIDDAIADRGEGYTVFSIPMGVLYRPPASKVKNLGKDYSGEAFGLSAPSQTTLNVLIEPSGSDDVPQPKFPSTEPPRTELKTVLNISRVLRTAGMTIMIVLLFHAVTGHVWLSNSTYEMW